MAQLTYCHWKEGKQEGKDSGGSKQILMLSSRNPEHYVADLLYKILLMRKLAKADSMASQVD